MKNNFLILGFSVIIIAGACRTSQKISESSKVEQATAASVTNSIKIAFGSCNDEDRDQLLWDDIEREQADLFLWLGDNIYGDSEDLSVLKKKYDLQNANKAYQNLKKTTPINGTWDDHDYGVNDGGKEFPSKAGSQQLALDFLDVPKDHIRRTRKGIHDKILIEQHGIKIDIFILDTRYFRDPLVGKKGSYKGDSKGTILGDQQWQWLDNELGKSNADYHVFLSSIQLISEEHGWEKWGNYPEQKNKFLDLIAQHNINYPIILSGDRHSAEFSMQKHKGHIVYDLTSSSLTHGIKNPRPEANKYRTPDSALIFEENYGVLEFIVGETIDIKASIKTEYNQAVIEEKLFAEAKR